jgi:drug/metabolite transporter (DMT)-like permease
LPRSGAAAKTNAPPARRRQGTAWCFACPQLLVLSLLLESGHGAAITGAGWIGWSGIAYGAVVVTIVSYGMWYPLMHRYKVSLIMPFTCSYRCSR